MEHMPAAIPPKLAVDVSVIMPVLNEASGIAASLRRAWATGAAEVIVVDGGSTDGTPALARQGGAQLIVSTPGRGLQLNAGARVAQGDVLLFLHADTWLAPDALRQIDAALCDACVEAGAFVQRIEATGIAYRWLERGNAWRAARLGLPYGDQGIFMRRSLFDRIGGYADIAIMEDLLLMKRVRRLTRPVLLPGPLHVSARRWRRYGVIRQTARNWLLLAALHLGVRPERLAGWYKPETESDPSLGGVGREREIEHARSNVQVDGRPPR